MKKALLAMVFIFWWAAGGAEAGLSLGELEEELTGSPEVLAAAASLSESRALEELQKLTGGARFFGELSLSGLNEPASRSSSSPIEGYEKLWLRAGVVFPIFGSWRMEKVRELEKRILSLEDELRLFAVRKANLTALRKAYSLLWAVQEKNKILERFLSLEDVVMPLLSKRKEKGFLLERDRLEMESWFAFARREAAAGAMLTEECLALIRKATGRKELYSLRALFPDLGPIPFSRDDLDQTVKNESGEVRILGEAAGVKREIARRLPGAQYNAHLRVGYGISSEHPGRKGQEGFISLTFDVPLREGRAASEAGKAALAGAEKTEYEREAMELAIRGSLTEGMARLDAALAQRAFALSNLRTAAEGVRADRLRYGLLPGDMLEQLFRSIFIYTSSALSLIESEGAILQAHCELLGVLPGMQQRDEGGREVHFSPEDPERASLLAPAWLAFAPDPPAAGVSRAVPVSLPRKSFYFWGGDNLLIPGRAGPFFEGAAREGTSRILVSFTGRGVKLLGEPAGKAVLKEALAIAKRAGITVELLLGDQSWILPDHRKELTGLVEKLGGLGFSGIHLDLEPDQLPGAESMRRELLVFLADTVRDVKKVSPVPVSLSIHPRYLEGELGPVAAGAFGSAGIREISVMIYSTGLENAASRMKSIISAWPGLRFSLAVSVEKELPPGESFFRIGKKRFGDILSSFEKKLASPGFAGIVVQSWENYREMDR